MRLPSFAIADQANLLTDDALKLSSSEPTPLRIQDIGNVAELATIPLGYPPERGSSELREEISKSISAATDPREIVVFNGAAEAIFVLLNCILEPGMNIVTPTPGHDPFRVVSAGCGAKVRSVPLKHSEGWRLDVDRVIENLDRETAAVIVNYPHNPTGTQIELGSLDAVAEAAERVGAVLILDEVYRGLELDGPPLPAARTRWPNAVSIGSLSKSHAVAGIRIGWIATGDERLRAGMSSFRNYTSLSNSALDEVVAVWALRQSPALLERVRNIARTNRSIFLEFLDRWKSTVDCVMPTAGITAFPRLADGSDAMTVARLLTEQNVSMFTGSVYGPFSEHFRVGLGREELPLTLDQLDHALKRLYR